MSMPRSNEIATWNKLHTNPSSLSDEVLRAILSDMSGRSTQTDRMAAETELIKRGCSGLPSDQKIADVIAKVDSPTTPNDFSMAFIKALASAKLRLIVDGTVTYPPNVIKAAKDELNTRGEMWETKPPTLAEAARDTQDTAAPATEPIKSTLDIQHGGEHYKQLGNYQPWEVLKVWLTPEEFRGFMKGTAIAYLAREQSKGKDMDLDKAIHTLQAYRELTGDTKDGNDKG